MPDPNVVLPGGMVPEIMSGTIVLELADGTQAVVQVPKARWELFADTVRTPHGNDQEWPMFAEQWYGARFLPLDRLPGQAQAAFRLVHYYRPGGPRVTLEIPETA